MKFPREQALEVVRSLKLVMSVACVRWIVAGSLRRRKKEVGDIEIVYIPRMATLADPEDLFAAPVAVSLLDKAVAGLISQGIISKRVNINLSPTWGAKNKLAVHTASGIPIDFFATDEECWFNYLVCRTGSAENNTRIASAALRRQWKWHPYSSGFADTIGRVVPVHSEREVFEHAQLPYLEPWER